MLSFSLWFLAGVYTATLINVTSPVLPMAIISVGYLLVALQRSKQFAAFLAGILYAIAIASHEISLRLPAEFSGDSLVVRVVVVGFPTTADDLLRMTVEPVSGSRLRNRLNLNWYDAPVSVRIGDEWQLEVRLRQPRGFANPGSADAELLALSRSVAAAGYVVNGPRNRLLSAAPPTSLDAQRQRIADRIEATLPLHSATPVLIALTVGSRHLFSASHWRDFAASGTAHLVAISGLHIGLIAFLCTLLGRGLLFATRCNQRRWSIFIGLFGAGCYLCISGLGLPAQRAFIMLTVAVVCLLAGRRLRAGSTLSVAALCIVLMNPLSIVQPGMWLSFAAVASLFWWSARQTFVSARGSTLLRLWTVQRMLFFALVPVTALIFGRLSISAPLANLFAVPVFSLVAVPAALAGALLPPPFDGLLHIAAFAVDLVAVFVEKLEPLQPLVIPASLFVSLSIAAAMMVFLPVGFPGRYCCICALPVLFLPAVDGPAPRCFRATFFDVGQGTSILVETRRHTLLYDTGPPYGKTGSAFEAQVSPALERLGIETLDRIIVSHADSDHAGGIHAATQRFPEADVQVGESLAGVDAMPCMAPQSWIWDGILFEVIHPGRDGRWRGNDRSCVLRVTTRGSSVLLTGDIEAAAEADLIKQRQMHVDVVSMPHHGSRTSSTLSFVAATSPVYAVVSAGYENRFGHPKQDIVERWQARSGTVLNTSKVGAIRLSLCANEAPELIDTSREDRRKLWHGSNGAPL